MIDALGIDYLRQHAPQLHAEHTGMSHTDAMQAFCREVSNDDLIQPLNVHSFWLTKTKVVDEMPMEVEFRSKR